MERQEVTALIAIDLSAAFDTVDYDVLLEVLRCQYGVSGTALDWVGSYLRSRGCRVSISGTLSSCCALDCSYSRKLPWPMDVPRLSRHIVCCYPPAHSFIWLRRRSHRKQMFSPF
ncbi:hypothetical protein DPMN_068071 [Dreissena polymorpha]|uniref:Reverse transcriptase domain-containing protein n=1 Tax=Dreissena polymorpha TaxID=45954 RepID=A0A9D4BLW0_DREPO|nr:hypothetical protein DPMN_068071 [Dreissena polymorpha]